MFWERKKKHISKELYKYKKKCHKNKQNFYNGEEVKKRSYKSKFFGCRKKNYSLISY